MRALEGDALVEAGDVRRRVAEPEIPVVDERERVLALEPLEQPDGPRAEGNLVWRDVLRLDDRGGSPRRA